MDADRERRLWAASARNHTLRMDNARKANPMTVELADINVEDLKNGYVIHDTSGKTGVTVKDVFPYQSDHDGQDYVDLAIAHPCGTVDWVTHERGTVVQVEA